MVCFRDELEGSLDIFYEGDGHVIAQRFYIPVLKRSTRYYRISGFFSVDSLVVIAAGLAGLIYNSGHMRLILGAHDLGPELREAYILSKERAEELLKEIGGRIAAGLERIEDIIARRRLEALAWMLANGTLEIRVAIPRKTFLGLGNGIFHEKLLLFSDENGCRVAAAGSANETRMAYEQNGENLTIHMTWREGHLEYINRYTDKFESLWEGRHPDYFIFPLPEAIEERLKEKFYPDRTPETDPIEDPVIRATVGMLDKNACAALAPSAQLVKELGTLKGLVHLGLGPVWLYPHQAFSVDFVLNRFPYRALLADEVGLGKTLEAGGIIKRLVDSGQVQRILILAPKNVTRQWLDEMWHHFGLRFWLLETNFKQFTAADDSKVEYLKNENPFEKAGVDFVVASWHYARGTRRKEPEIFTSSKFFDLVVIDEAHAARKKRYPGKVEPTRLHDLCMEISITSPHILMLSATPIQLYAVEALDLLRILGLGGPWIHESDFSKYYEILSSDFGEINEEDWVFAFRRASWIARNYLMDVELTQLLNNIFDDIALVDEVKQGIEKDRGSQIASMLAQNDPKSFKELLLALSPIQWFMVRNTREKLKNAGYVFPERIVEEEPVELSPVHYELLDRLDSYLKTEYGRYEKMLSPENRGVIGFVRSIYHQRFVSSFTAAYLTIRNRREFLEAAIRGDREALLRLASKLLEEEDLGDEEEIIDAIEELLERGGRQLIIQELNQVKVLEDALRDFSPDILSGNDPKLQKIISLIDELISEGHKVLVFSKYTDTVDAIVRFLTREGRILTKPEIGIYTGEGGQIFDTHSKVIKVGKEFVRKSLEEGPIRVLVCSDAAREGLNLQAASAIINVDMPWNPAKVEQRVGRADRLGQKAGRVIVKNIWYPNSIEAEMYRVLFERKEIYGVVIGPAQDIVSEAMRRALDEGAIGEKLREIVRDTLTKVEEVKEGIAKTGGALAGATWEGRKREEREVIERVASFGLKAARALGLEAMIEDGKFIIRKSPRFPRELQHWNNASLELGRPNALTPAHPIIRWLADSIISAAGSDRPRYGKSVYVIKDHEGLGESIVISSEGGAPEVYAAERIVDILDELLSLGEVR